MKHILMLIIIFFCCSQLRAQGPQFISGGTIEFERKINLFTLYSGQPQFVDMLKSYNLQFKKQTFLLTFSNAVTSYRQGVENPENFKLQRIPAEDNNIYSDLDKKARLSQKRLFDKTFLVRDTIRKILWKLTDEKRTIAGFECRRANAVIQDSIYIVAFFTEEILTRGGPESFSGLPGMILGVAIPELHITWFATKLSLKTSNIEKPSTGIEITYPESKEIFINDLKRNGNTELWYYKFALL